MKKIILFVLLFFATFLNANNYTIDISKNETIPIYKSIEIATNIKNIEDAITNPAKFREQKYFRRYLQFHKADKDSWFKIDIENSSYNELTRMLYMKWQNVDINFYLVENDKVIYKDSLLVYKNFMTSNPFTIKKDSKLQLYLNVKLIKGIDDFLYLYIVSPEELPKLISEKEKFHNGIFLGLLIAMMMYNFFMFFSMRIKSYFYLGMSQLMTIIYVSDMKYYLSSFIYEFFDISYWAIRIILTIFSVIFSIFFTKEFLKTKETMPRINILLNIFIFFYIFILLTESSLYYLDYLYIIFLIAGIFSLRSGNKFVIYYILGFFPKAMMILSMNISKWLELDIDINYHNVIQVASVIEAFALSMALYLKLKQTVDEKDKAQNEVHQKEKLILEQSRFATMGEMIGNIAHQWRQPLNNISSIFSNIAAHYRYEKLTQEKLDSKIDEANIQLKYMSKTIEDFMNYFSQSSKQIDTSLKKVCENALYLVEANLGKNNILVSSKYDNEDILVIKESELAQILIVLFNNSKDAFLQNGIKNPKISIEIKEQTIIYKDNAGGIPKDIVNKIFDPYFTTKDKKIGAGLGLYISKQIMENSLHGTIEVSTNKDITTFILNLSGLEKADLDEEI